MTGRRTTPDPWPPPWARKTAFFFGLALIGWEATIDASSHPMVYGLAFILTGLPIAQGVDRVLERIAQLLGRK